MLRLQVQIGENRDLNGAGLREDFVLVQTEVLAGGEVLDGDSHDAVKMLVDVLNLGFEFLPEHFLLVRGRSGNLAEARGEK